MKQISHICPENQSNLRNVFNFFTNATYWLTNNRLVNAISSCVNKIFYRFISYRINPTDLGKRNVTKVSGQPHIELNPNDTTQLKKFREPLITLLTKYFNLDSLGYILAQKSDQDLKLFKQYATAHENALADLFYDVSYAGDAAYAEDIRTTLAGLNITSTPVGKSKEQKAGTGPIKTTERPVSYSKSNGTASGTNEPPLYSSSKKTTAPAYIDAWGNAIWKGNRDFRHYYHFYKSVEKSFTISQIEDYRRRIERVQKLHKEGGLVGRVANMKEVQEFCGNRYDMSNDILSATLWPKANDLLEMELFCEFDKDTVGILLDPTRVEESDWGVSFHCNAATKHKGFLKHKQPPTGGASSLSAQKNLLEQLSQCVQHNESVDNYNITLASDRSRYTVTKKSAQFLSKSNTNNKNILWNEQTFYRGVEKNAFLGFFVKNESGCFSSELKNLFLLQDRIRRRKGIYVPIFQLDGETNQLMEIVPDELLLAITGAVEASPMPGVKGDATTRLMDLGINLKMAKELSQVITKHGGTIKSLFELQLLMFNMKDISKKISILQQNGSSNHYELIRIIDNLHLVFPTLHKTQNKTAKTPEAFFSRADIATIRQNTSLHDYLKIMLKTNLDKFLGITVDSHDKVEFNSKIVDLFEVSDVKKSDFSKAFSRALQSAVLFQIYGPHTNQIVRDIAAKVRKTCPSLGFTPSGADMILGSHEMQAILAEQHFPPLTPAVITQKGTPKPFPPTHFTFDKFNPFDPHLLQQFGSMKKNLDQFLSEIGINSDGTLNDALIAEFQQSDPSLFDYETALVSALQVLDALDQESMQNRIINAVQSKFPHFLKTAEGQNISIKAPDLIKTWFENAKKSQFVAEFPFQSTSSETTEATTNPGASLNSGKGKRFTPAQQLVDEQQKHKSSHMAGDEYGLPTPPPQKTLLSEKELIEFTRRIIPRFTPKQAEVAQRLGLIDENGLILCTIEPSFDDKDKAKVKPKNPCISGFDLLGQNIPHLLTGPACQEDILANDRASFEIAMNPKIITDRRTIEHLVTDTLAFTKNGDSQVLRANGLKCISIPHELFKSNEDIARSEAFAIAEKHTFHRDNTWERFYMLNNGTCDHIKMNGRAPWVLQVLYKTEDVENVEKHDHLLLNDLERRLKRAGLLESAYVTVTARGGIDCKREPYQRAHKVLYVATKGAQLDKYMKKVFTYQDGTIDANELDASDFIIKPKAVANASPLIDYYDGQGIPAYASITPDQCNTLNDGKFDQDFVILQDRAYFNRKAYQKSVDQYLNDFVLPTVTCRTNYHSIYLKAVLFGETFSGYTGNLRSELVYAMVKAYITAVQSGKIPSGSVLEFPRYGDIASLPKELVEQLKKAAAQNQVEIVWNNEGDVCDYRTQTTLTGNQINPEDFEKTGSLVVLGDANAMSWHGNIPSSDNIESAFANNSNLRLVMNWWANPKVLEVVEQISRTQ